jgi:hypothetical protein
MPPCTDSFCACRSRSGAATCGFFSGQIEELRQRLAEATEKAATADSLETAVAIAATDAAELRMRLAAAETAAAEADAGAAERRLEEADAERVRLRAELGAKTLAASILQVRVETLEAARLQRAEKAEAALGSALVRAQQAEELLRSALARARVAEDAVEAALRREARNEAELSSARLDVVAAQAQVPQPLTRAAVSTATDGTVGLRSVAYSCTVVGANHRSRTVASAAGQLGDEKGTSPFAEMKVTHQHASGTSRARLPIERVKDAVLMLRDGELQAAATSGGFAETDGGFAETEARCALATRHPYRDADMSQALKITEAILACVDTLWLNSAKHGLYDHHRVKTAARSLVTAVKAATKIDQQRATATRRAVATKAARATAEKNWNDRHLPHQKKTKRPRLAAKHAAKKQKIKDGHKAHAAAATSAAAAAAAAARHAPRQ